MKEHTTKLFHFVLLAPLSIIRMQVVLLHELMTEGTSVEAS